MFPANVQVWNIGITKPSKNWKEEMFDWWQKASAGTGTNGSLIQY
jgi:hypothetical protein